MVGVRPSSRLELVHVSAPLPELPLRPLDVGPRRWRGCLALALPAALLGEVGLGDCGAARSRRPRGPNAARKCDGTRRRRAAHRRVERSSPSAGTIAEPCSGTWWATTCSAGSRRRSSSNEPSPHIVLCHGDSIGQNASLGTLSTTVKSRSVGELDEQLDDADEALEVLDHLEAGDDRRRHRRARPRTRARPSGAGEVGLTRRRLARRHLARGLRRAPPRRVDEHGAAPGPRRERGRRGDAGAAAEVAPQLASAISGAASA